MAVNGNEEYIVVMFDADDWHGVSIERGWNQAVLVHRGAVNALRVIDHPHAERVKIIPFGANYSHEPLNGPLASNNENELESNQP